MKFDLRRTFNVIIGLGLFLLQGTCGIGLAKEKGETLSGDKLTFGANTRFRYEYQDNFNAKYYGDRQKKGEANDGFLLGRFRLGFDYQPTKKIHLALWMQHSEVWDLALKEEDFYKNNFKREHNPYEDSCELYNTYVAIDKLFCQPLSVKVGRQVIAYGDMRIFGPGQWGNTGRWIWDAAKLSYKFKAGFLDAFYGKTQLHDPNVFSLDHGHGFESFAVYSRFKLPDNLSGVVFEPFLKAGYGILRFRADFS